MDQHELVVRVLREAGGVSAEELLAPDYRGKRADIVFQAESLIAEVKSLTSDRRQDPVVRDKLGEVLESGVKFDAPIIFGTLSIGLHDLPQTVAERALRVIGSRVRKEVSSVGGQLAATRAALNIPDAYGLIVFVSPPGRIGNSSIGWLIHDTIQRSSNPPGLDGALVIETPIAAGEACAPGDTFSNLWSISGKAFPGALDTRIAAAWERVTRQSPQALETVQFRELGATD